MDTELFTVAVDEQQRALVSLCRNEHTRMDDARERKDVETILDCQARIGELTAQWWRLEREKWG